NATFLPANLARDLILTARNDELILRALRRLAPILEPDLLAAQIASFTGLEQSVSAALLKHVKLTVVGIAHTAHDLLFDDMMLGPDTSVPIDAQQFSPQLEALARLDKVGLLLANSGLNVERLDWLTDNVFDVVDINMLPSRDGQPSVNFADWRAWAELLLLVRSIPDGALTIDALGAALKAKAANPASTVDPDDVFARAYYPPEEQVRAAQEVREAYRDLQQMAWPADFRKPGRVLQLATLLNLLKQLKTPPVVVKKLLAVEPDEQDAIAARALFVAQFDEDTAPKRLQSVSDKLRPRQRDALVDYLRAANSLADADDLLDYFLIDVQMESCMRTSRIKQAIS